jgi:hypothetical protein
MKNEDRTEFMTRHAVLKLLSNEEFARVSKVDGPNHLSEGEEYLDLEQLGQGVRLAQGNATPMRRVLPKKALNADTWAKILQHLATPTSPTG